PREDPRDPRQRDAVAREPARRAQRKVSASAIEATRDQRSAAADPAGRRAHAAARRRTVAAARRRGRAASEGRRPGLAVPEPSRLRAGAALRRLWLHRAVQALRRAPLRAPLRRAADLPPLRRADAGPEEMPRLRI